MTQKTRQPEPVSVAIRLLESIGYDIEYTWRESHGNGGAHIMENQWGQVKSVHYDIHGNFKNIISDGNKRGSYKKAKDILAEIEREEPSKYTVLNTKISSCYTASYTDVRDKMGKYWRVTTIAGNGARALEMSYDESEKYENGTI